MTRPTRLDELDRGVQLQRRKGDALAKRGDTDAARQAYRAGCALADEALVLLGTAGDPGDVADWHGVRGGLLRRIGGADALSDALESYRIGAEIEASEHLPSTYNRANAIKLALVSGASTLAEQRGDLEALREVLGRRLSTDERAADDAWLWADFGDVQFLLGDQEGALSAYRTFASKSRTDSPATTLAVLREVVQALEQQGDADAAAAAASLAALERLF